jgi:uncharacterized protein YegL
MAENSDDKTLALAFYLVVDASVSMTGGPITAANQLLAEVISAVEQSPALADVVRLGALDFSDDSRTVLALGDLRDVKNIPQFAVRGGTSYAAAFRKLRKDIEADIVQLRSDNYKVYRPAVFFITDGEPTDDPQDLQRAFNELTDQSFKFRPNIVPFGVGTATKAGLDPWIFPKQGASKPMRSYVYAGGPDQAAKAIKEIAELLISSIISSVGSVNQQGTGGGFQLPDDDDIDGDWL